MPAIGIFSLIVTILFLILHFKSKIDEADKKKKQIDELKKNYNSQDKLPSIKKNDSEVVEENLVIYEGPLLNSNDININDFETYAMFILLREEYKIGDKIQIMVPNKTSSGDMLFADEKIIIDVTECYHLQISKHVSTYNGRDIIRLQNQKAKIDLFIPENLMEKYPDEDVSKCHTMIHWWLCLKDTKVLYSKIMKSIEAHEDDTWYMIRFVKEKNSSIYKHKTVKKKNVSDLQRKEKKQQSYTDKQVEENRAHSKPIQTSGVDPLKAKGDKYERYIGKRFEEKGDLVIYNGFIRDYEDGGVDIASISIDAKTINLIQCKHWSLKVLELDHIKNIYEKLNTHNLDFLRLRADQIIEHLSALKQNHEIEELLTTARKNKKNLQIRKTLYISSDKVVDLEIGKHLTMMQANIFRYQDMKIVVEVCS